MPPTGRFLLDTNIVIALLAGEQVVLDRVQGAEAVYLPATALGELYYGASQSARAQENVERLRALAATTAVLGSDAGTAAAYGELKAALRAKGTPIPENDIWIAAAAKQHDLTLASRDEHFDPGARGLDGGLVRPALSAPPN